ncbi:hypothetical protein FE783_07935 [Paenibacillus mesophilus]|uniref:hypothetical protein n=1 Tax=Paenibacillus mesophilus TaxID=2582849 RepID=UPI00110ED611|nr:hypothetical protein [Paenibacillus mesophilus]TMV50618.1 hypothetical protein FE783_07935 [Paenibacillus mesophilus]
MRKAMVHKVLLSLLFFIVSLSIAPKMSFACWCTKLDPKAELDRAEEVFSGNVIEIGYEQENSEASMGTSRRANVFEVDQAWKGVEQSRTIVYSNGGSCGFMFEEGKSYMVYTYDKNGESYTNFCNRTVELSQAGEDIKALGNGREIEKQSRLEAAEAETFGNKEQEYDTELLVDLLSVAAFALTVWAVQRRRRKR